MFATRSYKPAVTPNRPNSYPAVYRKSSASTAGAYKVGADSTEDGLVLRMSASLHQRLVQPPESANSMLPLTHALLQARASSRPVAGAVMLAPADLDAALAIQAEAFKARGEDVAGWKVAVRPDLGPVAAPIAGSRVIRSGDQLAAPGRGLLGIEIELAVRLGAPVRRPIDRAGLLAAADAFLVGVEICATRFTDVQSRPFLALLADDMSNYGYVMGEASPLEKLAAFELPRCQVMVNGSEIFSGPLSHPDGDPLTPALSWLGTSDGWGASLDAGQFITTGALCGLLPIAGPCQVEVLAERFGPIRFWLT